MKLIHQKNLVLKNIIKIKKNIYINKKTPFNWYCKYTIFKWIKYCKKFSKILTSFSFFFLLILLKLCRTQSSSTFSFISQNMDSLCQNRENMHLPVDLKFGYQPNSRLDKSWNTLVQWKWAWRGKIIRDTALFCFILSYTRRAHGSSSFLQTEDTLQSSIIKHIEDQDLLHGTCTMHM